MTKRVAIFLSGGGSNMRALVEDMTERYEEDIFAIERMPDVTFIAP